MWLLNVLPFVSKMRTLGKWRFLAEFILLVLPQAVVFIYPEYTRNLFGSMIAVAVFFLLARLVFGKMPTRISQAEYFAQPRLPFITYFRASIMILTMLCILAVDFSSFPRRWTKTESFGTSLMDYGVGCIIFSSGLVSASQFIDSQRIPFMSSFKSSLSMLVLGLLRLLIVKFVGYQEHVSEYGIHWNFFLTLASLPLLSNAINRIVSVRKFVTGSLVISILFEAVLKVGGLETFILEGHRDNIFAMNKEGISSLIGCLSLFMLSCGYGSMIQNVRIAKVKNRSKLMMIKMTIFTLVNWLLYYVASRWIGLLASRRLMNLSFVWWTSAMCSTHILLVFIMDVTFMSPIGQSAILTSINENQLLMFLMANLGTGLTNILVQTLLQPQSISLAILSFYALVLCGSAVMFKRLKLVLRLK